MQDTRIGPVLAIIGFDDEGDAVRIANDTPYGLATGRGDRLRLGARLGARLEARPDFPAPAHADRGQAQAEQRESRGLRNAGTDRLA